MEICPSSNTNILEEMVKGLSSLTIRRKWNYHYRSIETNDSVLLKEDNVPRSDYLLARIIKTYPQKDGAVTAIKVKTSSNTLVPPVGKICLMKKDTTEKSTSQLPQGEECFDKIVLCNTLLLISRYVKFEDTLAVWIVLKFVAS